MAIAPGAGGKVGAPFFLAMKNAGGKIPTEKNVEKNPWRKKTMEFCVGGCLSGLAGSLPASRNWDEAHELATGTGRGPKLHGMKVKSLVSPISLNFSSLTTCIAPAISN